MDGKALAARVRGELKDEVAELGHVGLATVLVGDDPASQVYIRLKHEAATAAGTRAPDTALPAGTATICTSRPPELARTTLDADIPAAAVGRPGLITADMVKPGATVIDVGITRTDAGLLGDVAPEVADVAAFLTPVPGGVGPVTIAVLLANAVRAARYRSGLLAFPRI